MKRIKIKPDYFHPDDIDYPRLCFLIEDEWAITTDGFYVSLVEVIPDAKEPVSYCSAGGQHLIIGIDDERTVAGLEEMVKQLKRISAFELLTKHYSETAATFILNRERSFRDGFGIDDQHPPVKLEVPDGQY